ncbi:MAG: tRNA pseudouridine(38-40) synthase TruA [Sphaerochaetaceae bacterium]|jgi:tRNA pseudouridine38-40 synthase
MSANKWSRPTYFPLDENKRRIKLVVSYDGTNFSGWQRQQGVRTVQQELEKILLKITKEETRVHGSGRTDAKVHALGQVAHFDTSNKSIPPEVFSLAINQLISSDIRVLESCEVTQNFHARYTAVKRTYRYLIKEIKDIRPFDVNRVSRIREFPPLELLNGYAKTILGSHDFLTFGAAADQSISTIRDIYISHFFFETCLWNQKVLVYEVCGNAFLMHQVRSMVGTMLQLAERKETVEEFAKRLEAKDRQMAGRTAAAHGLYLYGIEHADL